MIEFTVKDMTCGKCVKKIEDAIYAFDPQAEVDVDLETKVVSIISENTAEILKKEIEQAGYTPS